MLSENMLSEKILRFSELKELIPLSRSTLWRRVKNGQFPQPISLGGIAVGWKLSDVKAWINNKTSGGSSNG
jgi:prophage regulatory protein